MSALLKGKPLDSGVSASIPVEWVGIGDAAIFLGVKKSWLYNSGDKYGVPCTKLGNLRRYNIAQLNAYMLKGGCK